MSHGQTVTKTSPTVSPANAQQQKWDQQFTEATKLEREGNLKQAMDQYNTIGEDIPDPARQKQLQVAITRMEEKLKRAPVTKFFTVPGD